MKEFVEIHDFLASPSSLSDWHEDAELAADNLNIALHFIYERSDENIDANRLAELLENAFVLLSQNEYLSEFENTDEISDWVEQYLNDQL
ncbi:hypothetical protein HR060_04215 [Catenovulum sp. SM1970]|uniref:hypothetical protein n=1 Tax=Marinifaba aquimaris TaxID=2741323 RepID=UPI0015747D12|nr:hypothetical protein [Marinifaba aquimaris]NTS76065.1 hypothetical protein [Marinifaba aquimaris]